MSVADFRRSFGNITSSSTSAVVPPDAWSACAQVAEFDAGTRYTIGFDLDVDRCHGAIAAAAPLPDGRIAVEVLTSRPGAGWLGPQLEGMLTRAVTDPLMLGIGCGAEWGAPGWGVDGMGSNRNVGCKTHDWKLFAWRVNNDQAVKKDEVNQL
jgi:hypothetical protein